MDDSISHEIAESSPIYKSIQSYKPCVAKKPGISVQYNSRFGSKLFEYENSQEKHFGKPFL